MSIPHSCMNIWKYRYIGIQFLVFSWVKPSLGFSEDSSGFRRWADLDFLMPFSFNNIVLKALKVWIWGQKTLVFEELASIAGKKWKNKENSGTSKSLIWVWVHISDLSSMKCCEVNYICKLSIGNGIFENTWRLIFLQTLPTSYQRINIYSFLRSM